jgi:hypothetical protein
MMTNEIIAAIDAAIHKLQQVKALLNGSGDHSGRIGAAPFKKRTVSPEARARMATAQTARWAKSKKHEVDRLAQVNIDVASRKVA